MPVAIGLAALAQRIDVPAHRLEGDDGTVIEDLIAQEVAVLAGVGSDIEHAVYVQAAQQLAEMQRKVALLHLAQGHDVVAEQPADLEDGVLDDLEHGSLNTAR